MKPKDGRKALVVFSDGGDRGSKETLNDAIDALTGNVSIYTIYFKGEESAIRVTAFPERWRRGGMGGGCPAAVVATQEAAAVIRVAAGAAATETARASTARRSWSRLHSHRRHFLRQEERCPRRHLQPDADELRGQYLLSYTLTRSTPKRLPQDRPQSQKGRPDGSHARRLLRYAWNWLKVR